jgi:uncharacterized protein YecT (DUF1311 family)
MKLFFSLLLALVLTSGYLAGQGRKKPEPCADATSQADMNNCWGNEYKKADAQLNQTYQQLAALLDEEDKAELKAAENAWIKYRDANCDFVADQYRGGTMRGMILAICLADVTGNRTTELKNQIKDRKQ